MRINFLFVTTGFVVVASLLLGGGTRAGFLSDAILQLLALPLLLIALWRWLEIRADRRPRWVLPLCGSIALLFSLQLAPLPPAIWTALPQRELIIEAFRLIDYPLPWKPISVAPSMTRSSLLSLIPPLAIFFAISNFDRRERRRLSLLLLPVGVVSVMIGLAQVAQGPDSSLRFFSITNPTEAVGFFANRNHFAAFLYCSIVLAAAWVSESAVTNTNSDSRIGLGVTSFIAILIGVTTIVILLVGQAMARSRAGIALTIVALIGSFALAYSDKRHNRSSLSSYKLLIGSVAFAIALSLQFTLSRILGRFDGDLLEDARWTIARRTIEAASAYFPFGAGIGTFVPVYTGFERPEDVLPNAYVNRAHNDFLEFWLECGIFGIALIIAFAAWWVSRTLQLWRRSADPSANIEQPYARAASLIIALLLAHSFVDYPLRTAAMMTFFALACALMTDPPTPIPAAPQDDARPSDAQEATQAPSPCVEGSPAAAALPRVVQTPASPFEPPTPWPEPPSQGGSLQEIEWPEQWRGK
jgi:O-antigen ligase